MAAAKNVNVGAPLQQSGLRRIQNSLKSYAPRIAPMGPKTRDYGKVQAPEPMKQNSSPFYNTGMTGET